MGAGITGWGTALPAPTLDNRELAERCGVSAEWILERTGIASRRVAGPADTTVSLAVEAGAKALRRAGRDAADLDLIIVATVTPDYQMPAAATMVQAALGAGSAGAFDTNAACAGFVYALAQAVAFVDSGAFDRILVCGADVLTRATDYTDASSCVLFGDGAGAVIVEEMPGRAALGPFLLGADGSGRDLLFISPDTGRIVMQGRDVYRRAVEVMSASVQDVIDKAGLRPDEIRLIVAHQANARILLAVAERLSIPADRFAMNISSVGNTSAASVPLALAEAADDGRLKSDDIVVLTAFGAGFAWGGGVVRWAAAPAVGDSAAYTEVASV